MEEAVAEELIAVCRRDISKTFDQPGDLIYCLNCLDDLKDELDMESSRGAVACGGEYQWVTKGDFQPKRPRCSKCGEIITPQPRLQV
jgi:hypothetical protein